MGDVPSFLGEAKFDHSGMRVAYAGDVNRDGYEDFMIAAPNNGEGGNNAGKVYLMLGSPRGWQANQSLASAAPVIFIGEEANDNAGLAIGFIGDVNGDGLDDILIGAPNNSENGVHTGKCYLFLGRKSWESAYNLSKADVVFLGEREGDRSGAAVSYAGDVNGDGLSDFLIGAPENREGGESAGKAYLLLGRKDWPKRIRLYYADASFTGEDKDDKAGGSLAFAGDVNGDGYDDILIGAPNSGINGAESGQAYLVLGRKTGWKTGVILSHADASFTGEGEDNNAAFAISYAGDVNGDGLSDFVIGAPGNSQAGSKAGKCYVILGRKTGWKIHTPLAQNPVSITGENDGDHFGTSLAYAGDVNGDGLSDFLAGANRNSEANNKAGKVYLFYGRAPWPEGTEARDADIQYLGEQRNDLCGGYIAYAGDVNGSSLAGFVIGADSSGQAAHSAGKTYLVTPRINSQPTQISQLKLMADQSFRQELATQLKTGEELFIQLTGPHPDSQAVNAAAVEVSASPANKLAVRLTETAPNSGIFRGRVKLTRTGTERFARRLAVRPGDIIKIASKTDPRKSIQVGLRPTLMGYSVAPGLVPGNSGGGQAPALQDGNGFLKAGETAELALKVANYYFQPLKGVKVTLSGSDPYIKLIKPGASVGNIGIGESQANKEKLVVSVADNYPPDHQPSLKLLIQAQPDLSWQEDFTLKISRMVAIRGHISDRYSNQPVAKAKIFYGKQTIAARPDGSFTLHLPQSDKPALLRVGAGGYLFWKSRISAQKDQEITVKLPPRWQLDNAAASFVGEAPHDFSGWTVTGVGDVNGDGYDDFAVAAKNSGAGGSGAGQVYLFFGRPGGWEKGMIPFKGLIPFKGPDLSRADASFVGEAAGNEAGYAVAGVGDVNGSGFDSFVIGAPGNSQAGDKAGKIYLITGKAVGWKMRTPLDEAAPATFIGERPSDRAGYALSYAGDVNGDGYNDILVGAPGSKGSGLHSGQVYIIFGKPDGWGKNLPLSDADASFAGEATRDVACRAVSYAGDVNGDGYDDFLNGAPDHTGAKDFCVRTYLIFGHPPGLPKIMYTSPECRPLPFDPGAPMSKSL
ncbi:MAG: FG-GAP repeat protein [Deltaproteobacteria bacterium]|nr:FG-GAP repeat protein [Deltaproteobacteria bacterium]